MSEDTEHVQTAGWLTWDCPRAFILIRTPDQDLDDQMYMDTALGIAVGALFDHFTTHRMLYFKLGVIAMAPQAMFALSFPKFDRVS